MYYCVLHEASFLEKASQGVRGFVASIGVKCGIKEFMRKNYASCVLRSRSSLIDARTWASFLFGSISAPYVIFFKDIPNNCKLAKCYYCYLSYIFACMKATLLLRSTDIPEIFVGVKQKGLCCNTLFT